MVVPLRRQDCYSFSQIPDRLMPGFDIEGVACLLETPKLAAVPTRLLKAPVASLTDHQTAITSAPDFLFYGY
ncbi:MAG: CcdB family protein [Chromatiales bacterium]|nr:CcdB family protein [Chromatiales bacterium]